MAEKCKNSSFFVPKPTDNLRTLASKFKMDHLAPPINIWTDYERFNRTHFWSDTAKEWWSFDRDQLRRFKDSVLVNGYKKLKNYIPPASGCCVCVVKQKLKWQLKCLILFVVASLVFAFFGIILGPYFKRHIIIR